MVQFIEYDNILGHLIKHLLTLKQLHGIALLSPFDRGIN